MSDYYDKLLCTEREISQLSLVNNKTLTDCFNTPSKQSNCISECSENNNNPILLGLKKNNDNKYSCYISQNLKFPNDMTNIINDIDTIKICNSLSPDNSDTHRLYIRNDNDKYNYIPEKINKEIEIQNYIQSDNNNYNENMKNFYNYLKSKDDIFNNKIKNYKDKLLDNKTIYKDNKFKEDFKKANAELSEYNNLNHFNSIKQTIDKNIINIDKIESNYNEKNEYYNNLQNELDNIISNNNAAIANVKDTDYRFYKILVENIILVIFPLILISQIFIQRK